MNDIKILKALSKFFTENIASEYDPDLDKVGLEKPRSDNKADTSFALVKPAVFEGWIPPMNYLDDFGGYAIPGILIMSDGGSDRDGEAFVRVRVVFSTYDLGMTRIQTEKFATKPDMKGYYDLLNLITLTRMKLVDRALVADEFSANDDFEWGLYEEQKHPYWHAWITFSCPILPAKACQRL